MYGDWGVRGVCFLCNLAMDEPVDTFFRSSCPDCGNKLNAVLCRSVVRRAPFVWWNPLTWFVYDVTIEVK